MATQITIPTTADLPKDWKSTVLYLIAAIITLGKMYLESGTVTWYGALIVVGIAVTGYFLQKAKVLSPAAELAIEQKIEATVAAAIAKQPVIPAATAAVEEIIKDVAAAPSAGELSPAAGVTVS